MRHRFDPHSTSRILCNGRLVAALEGSGQDGQLHSGAAYGASVFFPLDHHVPAKPDHDEGGLLDFFISIKRYMKKSYSVMIAMKFSLTTSTLIL